MVPEIVSQDAKLKLKYFHAVFGSTPIPTFKNAIKRGYFCLPGVGLKLIDKYLKPQEETDAGHMKRIRQGMNSSKPSN
jgi:hypothetical protein